MVDTSLFTNPVCSQLFSQGRVEAFHNILKRVDELKCEIFMTDGAWEELMGFIPWAQMDHTLAARLRLLSPDLDKAKLPALLVKELVSEFRARGDQALKYACKAVSSAYNTAPKPRPQSGPHPVSDHITRLRENVRHHLREGFIDSVTDLETLMLARQLSARLVTGDEGMKRWARRLGIELLAPERLVCLIPRPKTKRKRVCDTLSPCEPVPKKIKET